MFQVGDGIVYPMHGAGMIKSVEDKEFLGEKQPYYIINMLIGNMKVMIPKGKTSKLSIRPVTDLAAVKKISMMFENQESEELLPWKQRHKLNTDKIKTGQLVACAEVVSSLIHIRKEKQLNSSEKTILDQAQKFMLSELELVEGMTENKIEKFMSRLTQSPLSIS